MTTITIQSGKGAVCFQQRNVLEYHPGGVGAVLRTTVRQYPKICAVACTYSGEIHTADTKPIVPFIAFDEVVKRLLLAPDGLYQRGRASGLGDEGLAGRSVCYI